MSSTPLVDASIANGQNNEVELRSRQRAIEANRRNLNAGTPKDKEAKLRDSCEGFEAMFIQKMWEGMRSTLPKDGMMQSRDEKHWQSMYDQELGKSMAKSGGIGLADMMVSQLSRDLQNASEVAAGSTARKPMSIAPVPLLPEGAAGDTKPATARQQAMAPTVALAPGTSGAAGTPGTTGAAGAASAAGTSGATGAAGAALTDIYGGPAEAPVAPDVSDASQTGAISPTGATGATGAAGATGATGAVAQNAFKTPSSPEVQAALANLAAQAAEARNMGAKAAQQHTAMTAAAFNNLPPAAGAATGGAGTPGPVSSLGSAGTKGAVIPGISFAAGKTASGVTQDDIPPSTFRGRVSPRVNPIGDQPGRARTRRSAQTAALENPASPQAARLNSAHQLPPRAVSENSYGSNFANSPVSPSAGQNMPTSSLADAAADLMKSQVQPSVKTKL